MGKFEDKLPRPLILLVGLLLFVSSRDEVFGYCSGRVMCPVQITPDSGGGSKPSTNGREFVYQDAKGNIVSNTRGVLARGLDPDINTKGEVVYVGEIEGSDGRSTPQIFSTIRGQLTRVIDPHKAGARKPSINSLGEVVYMARDAQNRDQIFSTLRGQLTFITDGQKFGSVDGPEIDNKGRVVFSMNDQDGENIWQVDDKDNPKKLSFFKSPKQATQPTLAAETGELVYVLFDQKTHILSLVSERDGVIFEAEPDPGANFGVFPDLSPEGILVFHGHKNSFSHSWLAIRSSDGSGNICSAFGKTNCPPPLKVASQKSAAPKQPVTKIKPPEPEFSWRNTLNDLKALAKDWEFLPQFWVIITAVLAIIATVFWKLFRRLFSFLRMQFRTTTPSEIAESSKSGRTNSTDTIASGELGQPTVEFGSPQKGAREQFISWWHIPVSLQKSPASNITSYEYCTAYLILEHSTDPDFSRTAVRLRVQSDNEYGDGEFAIRRGEDPKLLPIAIRSERNQGPFVASESRLTDHAYLRHGKTTRLKDGAQYLFRVEIRYLDRRWQSPLYELKTPDPGGSNSNFILTLRESA